MKVLQENWVSVAGKKRKREVALSATLLHSGYLWSESLSSSVLVDFVDLIHRRPDKGVPK
ncbi:hypothetical protein [Glutamicibacter creatinolyticus]|uniref:hypothetical protein n=1 Tax=Glutamicibacter creatinolyticus TaxID=162496 RepID=UPI001586C108|nr:hypothetical protein [Glutamicibacter creatinolyticus]